MATKVMSLRRDDACTVCSTPIPAGAKAQWDSTAKAVTCLGCVGAADVPDVAPHLPATADTSETSETRETRETAEAADRSEAPPIDVGAPGRSAREEHLRRQAKREAQIEETWGTGRIGKVARFLSDDPQTTKAWAQGAAGEERVAQVLHERLGDAAVLLHDRKVPGTRGNIDHLAISASGVWVIDAKNYTGRVEQRDVGRWLTRDLRLYVGGWDRTTAVTGMAWQIEAVDAALDGEDVPIHAAVTFVAAEWPILFAKPLWFDGVLISWPKKLAELIAAPGPLDPADIDRIARSLSAALPSK